MPAVTQSSPVLSDSDPQGSASRPLPLTDDEVEALLNRPEIVDRVKSYCDALGHVWAYRLTPDWICQLADVLRERARAAEASAPQFAQIDFHAQDGQSTLPKPRPEPTPLPVRIGLIGHAFRRGLAALLHVLLFVALIGSLAWMLGLS